jgi:peptidoglycan/xylan/chitin deacetylase (PgdA/CDA1 family)
LRVNLPGRLQRTAGRLRDSSDGRVLILLYHRVARLRSDPWGLAVTPGRFDEHLQTLREYATPMQLGELNEALRNGKLPKRSVVVTFDDGYLDNLRNAKPLLERHGVPATVFVASGFIGRRREFWWDELDRLVLQPGVLPERVQLNVDGKTYHWELGETADYTEEEFRSHRGWKAWNEGKTPRHQLYTSLYDLLRPLSAGDRRKKLGEVREWRVDAPGRRPWHRPLSAGEIGALRQGGLVEVGAHTVNHPLLSDLPPRRQRREIEESKVSLEQILGHPVRSFSYPYGKPRDYTAKTVDLVRRAGFACACSTSVDVVRRSSDPFQLPRVWVRNTSGEKLAKQLGKWFEG